MYTLYFEKCPQWARATKAAMRIQQKPGDTMEVDWAGATLEIHDPVTGEVSKAYLFEAVLPCSCFTYAEACDDMKLENWIIDTPPSGYRVCFLVPQQTKQRAGQTRNPLSLFRRTG